MEFSEEVRSLLLRAIQVKSSSWVVTNTGPSLLFCVGGSHPIVVPISSSLSIVEDADILVRDVGVGSARSLNLTQEFNDLLEKLHEEKETKRRNATLRILREILE